MPAYRITPLTPILLWLLGAALIPVAGATLPPRHRRRLAVVVSTMAVLSLFFVGSRHPADVQVVRILARWLDEPAIALRVPPFEPFLWVLALSLLSISLAGDKAAAGTSPLSQALLFTLTATAAGVVLAGSYRSLAFALFIFDGTAAMLALAHRRPGPAVGRLLLGVLSSTLLIAQVQGLDRLSATPPELGGPFSLTLWLRLGLYPLLEAEMPGDSSPPLRLGWTVVNLAVGLYLTATGVSAWIGWLAGATTLLHSALAWLEPSRERALAHLGYALSGGILWMSSAAGKGPAGVAASTATLVAVVALELTSPRLGRPAWSHPERLWNYLPPLLATVSLIGVPFTLGWEGRGALYRTTWEAGVPGAVALSLVAEGMALSVLYRYWRRLLKVTPAKETSLWRPLGAVLVCLPFLIPLWGPRLLSPPASAPLEASPGAALGLVGSLLWALFLGYGRRRLLRALPFSRQALMGALRLGWLLRALGRALDTIALTLLRIRAVIEGEHYLAWAVLLATGLGLFIALR